MESVVKDTTVPDPVATLEHQARLFPENEAIRRRLAEAHETAGRFAEALRIAEPLSASEPANAALTIRLLLRSPGDAGRRLDEIERRARLASVSMPTIVARAMMDTAWIELIEAAGRRVEIVPTETLQRALEAARAEESHDNILRWTRLLAERQPENAAAQQAWFLAAKEAGRHETNAIEALWKVARDEPWILKERWRRRGERSKNEILRDYLGPLDPEIAGWFLEEAIAKGNTAQFLPLIEAIGKNEIERRADLIDGVARGLVKARLFDDLNRLDALVSLRDSVRRAIADALIAAERHEDAIRFGETSPGVATRAALARGDTAAALGIAVQAFGGGRLDLFTLDLLLRHSPDAGRRRLAALHARIRGIRIGASDLAGFLSTPAKLLLATDPVERAKLYWEWNLPRRTAAILAMIPRAEPGLRVRAALRTNDTATAAHHLAAALARETQAIDLHLLAFQLAERRRDSTAMILHLEAIHRHASPEDRGRLEELLARLAPLYADQGVRALPDRGAALAWFERAARRDPRAAVVLYNIALLHSQSERFDSAIAAIEKALESEPDDINALILFASLLKKKERHADAVTAYRRAIDAGAPIRARHELALLLQSLGEIQGAYVAAAEAYRLMPGDAELARTYGVIAAQISRWSEAIDPLRQAVRARPNDIEARLYLAHSFLECGRSGEARSVIAAHPDANLRTEILARAELAENHPERAVELLRPNALRLGRGELLIRAISHAADAALSRGEVAVAQRYWNEWLRIDSKAEAPRALIAATRGTPPRRPVDSATAESRAVPAPPIHKETGVRAGTPRPPLAAAPTQPDTVDRAPQLTLRDAAASLRDGDHVRAEAAARQVLARRRANTEALNLLGIALGRQGRREAAISAFEESLTVNPNQPEVREAIRELKQP